MKKRLLQGIDLFDFSSLKGRKTALIINHTSVDKRGRPIIEKMAEGGAEATAIFTLEHGYFPVAQDMESVEKENKINGIPLYSLYGNSQNSLSPDPKLFELFDVVVYDVQDVGSRYYTYLATLAIFMDKLQENHRELIVLDRINPIGGAAEGAMLDEANYKSFVGYFPLLHRHGLTSGEVANYYYKLRKYDFPFKIQRVMGWKRDSFFDDYDYPWVPTSPNMPTLETAILYPGGCLLEGTELSEGRGSTTPFLLVGFHGMDPFLIKRELDKREIAGIKFIPMEFRPMFQKFQMKRCGGIYISLTDRNVVKPLRAYISIIATFRKILGDDCFFRSKPYEFIKEIPAIELLLGDKKLIDLFMGFASDKEIDFYLQNCEKLYLEQFREFRIYD